MNLLCAPSFVRFGMIASALAMSPLAEAATPPRVGVLLKSRGAVWGETEEGIMDAGKALGVEIVFKQSPGGAQPALQRVILNALLKENLDALILAPIEPERLEESLRPYVKKGLKIVALDTPLAPDLSKVFATHNQDAMSKEAGEFAADLVKDGDEIAILRFQQTDRAVLDRERKIMNVLRTRLPNAKIRADIFAATGLNSIEDQVSNLLEKYPDAKLVITSTYGATKSMMRVLRDGGLGEKINLVGFGIYLPEEMAAAIEDGSLDVWIAQKPKDLGTISVGLTVALLKGETVPAINYTDFTVVTKKNLNSPAVQDLIKEAVVDASLVQKVEPATQHASR